MLVCGPSGAHREALRCLTPLKDVRESRGGHYAQVMVELVREWGLAEGRIGLSEVDPSYHHYLPVNEYNTLREGLPNATLEFVGDFFRELVHVKSAEELACVEKAGELMDQAVYAMAARARPGVTEYQLAAAATHAILDVGGALDNFLMRLVDVTYTVPRIVLLLVLAKLVGPGLVSIIVILVALEWTSSARLTRGMVLSLREQAFVEAARSVGASPGRVLFGHIVPNSLAPLIVAATLDAGAAIRAETTLSFLGLGIQPPMPSWGNLLTNSSFYLFTAPWQVFMPGVFIFIALMSFNLLGDGLRDALDPRLSQRGG